MSHDGKWNHVLCQPCWALLEGEREPVLVKDAEPEPCCRCEGQADPPIFIRGTWEEFHPGTYLLEDA